LESTLAGQFHHLALARLEFILPFVGLFFERARKKLESKLPQPIGSRFESLVVTRQENGLSEA
jgi:hypothetical protein